MKPSPALSHRSWNEQAHSQQVFLPLKKDSNTKTSFTSDYIKWKCLRAKNARGHATADRTKYAVQAEFPTKTKIDHATQIVPFFESRKCQCIKRRANQITALLTLFSDTRTPKQKPLVTAHTHTHHTTKYNYCIAKIERKHTVPKPTRQILTSVQLLCWNMNSFLTHGLSAWRAIMVQTCSNYLWKQKHSDNSGLKPQDEANFAQSTEEGNPRGARGP